MNIAEFDEYARNYHKQMDHRFRKIIDPTENYFVELKAKFLHDFIKSADDLEPLELNILEVGCGLGDYVKILHNEQMKVIGLDLSFEMIKYAKINTSKTRPPLLQADGNFIPFKNNCFDIVFSICVFHHINSSCLNQVIGEISRVCKRGGKFILFEHNPMNLITQFVVRTTPIDRNAKLLDLSIIHQILAQNNFSVIKKGYLLFGPRQIDQFITENLPQIQRLPLGGQYYICAINN